jgi:molecular chaperone GrpE (heat shock protein)
MAPSDQKINETVNKAADTTKDELKRVKAELEELRRKSGPKVDQASSALASPQAIGFYQGKFNCVWMEGGDTDT